MRRPPRDEATELVTAAVAYARRMLRKYGEFAPFAKVLMDDGQIVTQTVTEANVAPDAAALLALLMLQLRERARRGRIRAVAIATNMAMPEPSAEGYMDEILVEVEHERTYAATVSVPYRRTEGALLHLLPTVVRVGKAVAREGQCRIFGC